VWWQFAIITDPAEHIPLEGASRSISYEIVRNPDHLLKIGAAGSSEKTLRDSRNTLRRISEDLAPMSLFCQLLGDLYRISLQ
jgi:hypothetical protein